MGSDDNDIKDMAENEIKNLKENLDELLKGLELSLLPEDPNDENNVFLEIRAGTGGLEAALFAGDLFKMYCRYAERNNWNIEKLTESPGDHGGFKQIVIKIIGKKVYSNLNLSLELIEFKECQRPNHKVEYTPPQQLLLSFLK